MRIRKFLKYAAISIIALWLLLVGFLGIYPEISKVRRYCHRIEIGMTRTQAEKIIAPLLAEKLDRLVAEEDHIYLMRLGVDCAIQFDENEEVERVDSAVDAL